MEFGKETFGDRLYCKFFVDGKPVAKQSFRVGRGRGYTSSKVKNYQEYVEHLAARAMQGKKKLLEAVKVDVVINRAYTAEIKKSKKKLKMAECGYLMPTTRPDLDNCTKGILDAMNKVVYEDDGQICFLSVCKQYAPEDGVSVFIYDMRFRCE
jgi:Holliday junction resolvase RusA-like endonuclease